MANGVQEIGDHDFQNVVQQGTVLVDFWAPWCGPCRSQGPILEELAEELGEKAVIAKINVDSNRQVAGQLGIQSIPTLMLFKDGEPMETFIGVQPKDVLRQAIG